MGFFFLSLSCGGREMAADEEELACLGLANRLLSLAAYCKLVRAGPRRPPSLGVNFSLQDGLL